MLTVNKHLIKFISVLLLGASLPGYATSKEIMCPPMELIKNKAGDIKYAANTAPDNYTAGMHSSIMYMKDSWHIITLIVAKNKHQAINKANANIKSIYQQFNLIAIPKDKVYECGYLGKQGSIFVFTDGSAT